MRESGAVTARALDMLASMVRPGVTTQELDAAAERFIRKAGAVPLFKGYRGFPKSITVSVNEEVVHGIPGKRKLREGDIVSIDLGVKYKGYCSDAALTVPVGSIDEENVRLLEVTREALNKGIAQAVAGRRLGDISSAIQQHVESFGYNVVRDLVGHGIGEEMHEEPQIPNYGDPGVGPLLEPGIVLAIEPMVNMGTYEVACLDDNWTIITRDHRNSAHYEHTVAVTGNGPMILTLP
jgi:methionyl aminopeptidase